MFIFKGFEVEMAGVFVFASFKLASIPGKT